MRLTSAKTRREFLTTAAIGSAGAAALPLLGVRPALAANLNKPVFVKDGIRYRNIPGFSNPLPQYTQENAPYGFLEGFVSGKEDASRLWIKTRTGDQLVQLTPRSGIWKGGASGANALNAGDFLYVQTYRDGHSPEIEVRQIWANMAWVRGESQGTTASGLMAVSPIGAHGGSSKVQLDNKTLVFEKGSPAQVWSAQRFTGRYVECLGTVLPSGVLAATRIWPT
jgi:hypothetical protein